MNFIKNVLLVFKSYFGYIGIKYKKDFLFLFLFSSILNLIIFLKYGYYIYAAYEGIGIRLWAFEIYFNCIFLCSNIMAINIIVYENQTEYFEKILKKKLTAREIITGKVLTIYSLVLITTFILLAFEIIELIKINLLFPLLLPTIATIMFFYCTLSILIASLKNKKIIIIAITSIIIYTSYSSIPLIFYEKSPSIMYAIIFGHYSSIEISSVIKYSYLPLHLILSIILIYFVSPFVENK